MAANIRNKFVMRHFCYYFMYLVSLFPYYVYSIQYLINDGEFKYHNLFNVAIILHLSLGFIMFIIRASETKFYRVIFCQTNKNQNNYIGSSQGGDENEKKKIQGEITEGFLDPDQPLTVMINKTLNLEFMCCVLFGLSTIFSKTENKNEAKGSDTGEASNILINSSIGLNQKSLNPNTKKGITK